MQEELSICCRWLVKNGATEEHFLSCIYVHQLDAGTITAAIRAYLDSKGFDYRKLVGQGYDGASPFSGMHNGIQNRICTVSGHAIDIHCVCYTIIRLSN